MNWAGVDLLRQKDYVYRLAMMKRFTDAALIIVLGKMRKPGGCKLTSREWSALQETDISKLSATEQRRRLEGTELWYQSGFTWATVAMAQHKSFEAGSLRSILEPPCTLYLRKITC